MKYFWSLVKANLHGFWYLLRWPPEAHQVCVEKEFYNWQVEESMINWVVYCHQCGKVFGQWKE